MDIQLTCFTQIHKQQYTTQNLSIDLLIGDLDLKVNELIE